jgi:hypothetical protein
MMGTEQSVEWKFAMETEVRRENLPYCHFGHLKSHMTWLFAWTVARPFPIANGRQQLALLSDYVLQKSSVLDQFISVTVWKGRMSARRMIILVSVKCSESTEESLSGQRCALCVARRVLLSAQLRSPALPCARSVKLSSSRARDALNDIKFRNGSYGTTWLHKLYFLEHSVETFIRGNPCS